ncbi:MAG: hypothetical protein M1451_11650, partial [Acidobacteria bacterium]|nr:hypothetical protein [Acidobacteriota bacterium]
QFSVVNLQQLRRLPQYFRDFSIFHGFDYRPIRGACSAALQGGKLSSAHQPAFRRVGRFSLGFEVGVPILRTSRFSAFVLFVWSLPHSSLPHFLSLSPLTTRH